MLRHKKDKVYQRNVTTSWYVESITTPRLVSRHSIQTETVEEKDSSSLDFVPWLHQKNKLGGSMEQLLSSQPQLSPGNSVGPFRRETGDDSGTRECHQHALLENPESETRWYFKYFLGKFHQNFLCYDCERNPCFLSVVTNATVHRCIIWRRSGNKRLCFKSSSPSSRQLATKNILEKFNAGKFDKTVREITSADLQKDLLTLEEQEGSVSFKVGVVYARTGQTTDVEMMCNKDGSPEFNQFLDLLGDTVTLKRWEQFKGGLDTRSDATGTHSVYTVFEGHEIMFHVSTMLPYSEDDEQQLERKRHIGNDIVTIIFFDGDDDKAYESSLYFYPAASFKSHFNHIFALVTYSRSRNSYRLVIHSAKSVPEFGPPLPSKGEFTDQQDFRDFLLAKLINGEKAAYAIPTFTEKRVRTLEQLIKSSEQKYLSEARRSLGAQLGPPSYSPSGNRKYLEMEQKFTDVGQKLKVQKILLGHHPHSKKTTALKKQPWEVFSICEEFPYTIVCGDACDDDILIVTTPNNGTYMVFANGSMTLIIDRGIPIAQLSVAHRHQLLMFRTAYVKETNYFYVVPLDALLSDRVQLTDKSSISSFMLPYTKGCHLFCTSELDARYLRVVVASKNKINMLVWRHQPAAGFSLLTPSSPITPTSPLTPSPLTPSVQQSSSTEGFIKHRELTLNDVPVMMALLDVQPSGKLCLAYQKSGIIEAVDEFSNDSLKLFSFDPVKTTLTVLHSYYQSGRGEMLVGHNMTSQSLTINEGMMFTSPEIVWNSEPKKIAVVLPYIFAFTTNSIEIRMAANGSLMHTIYVPDLNLISSKGNIIFTSSSPLKQSSRLMESASQTRPDGKLARVLDKKPFLQSSGIYIYKIMANGLVCRRYSAGSLKQMEGVCTDDSSSESRCSLEEPPHTLLETSPENGQQRSGSETPPSPISKSSFTERRRRSRQVRSRPRRNMRVIPDNGWIGRQDIKNGFMSCKSNSQDTDSIPSPPFSPKSNLLALHSSSSSTPSLI